MGRFLANRTATIQPFEDDDGKWWWAVSDDIDWEVGPAGSGWTITIPKGFETDLGSIPWWSRWLFNPADPEAARSYVLHDRILGLGLYSQQFAVAQLYESLRNDGVARWSRIVQCGGVTLAIDNW